MSSVLCSKNDGVSPIIGTILLVAMTTVFVGIIGAALMGGFGMTEPTPIFGAIIDQQGNTITISHMKGDVLNAADFKIMVDGVDKTANFGATGDFGPGMMLSWDSGITALGTVSVVYTSGTGISTIIADKKFGKTAGAFTDRYSLINGINGTQFVLDVAAGNPASINLGTNTVYYDMDGSYWVSIGGQTFSQVEANVLLGTASQATREIYYSNKGLIKIDLSKAIYTIYDIDSGNKWKSAPYPVKGSLYENTNSLYMCKVAGGTNISPSPTPNADWVKIATYS